MSAPSIAPLREVTGKPSILLGLGSFYLGIAFALPMWADIETELISTALLVATLMALVGWRNARSVSFLSLYLLWASAFTAWYGISALSAWEPSSLYRAVTMALWLLLIVPGLGGLWKEEPLRRAFMLGVMSGVLVYAFTAAVRLASGDPVRDVAIGGEVGGTLLGMNRNGVNIRAVMVLPFLMTWNAPGRWNVLRWIGLAFVAMWIVTSGGRSGIVGAAVVLILSVVLQPGIGRRIRVGGVALLLAIATFFAIESAGGPAAESTERLTAAIRGERTSSDEIRELAARKAWHAAVDHPLLGIGPRSLVGYFHPVINEAHVTRRVRRIATQANAHNTYAELLAITGFPGGVLFIMLIGSVMLIGIRHSRHGQARVATSALGGVIVILYFHTGLASPIFYALALVMGAAAASGDAPAHNQAPTGVPVESGQQRPIAQGDQ